MNGVFVTGTDTGIGKTVVSTILALKENACYWKPIQAGTKPLINDPTDGEFVANYIGHKKVLPETFRLKYPLSPHYAATLERIDIDEDSIKLPSVDKLIVEGAGGALVPINSQTLMVDLMKKFKLPIIIVASSKLGTINHTLLTIEALRNRNLPIYGVALVGKPNESNYRAIEYFGKVKVVLEVPWVEELSLSWMKNFVASLKGNFIDGNA